MLTFFQFHYSLQIVVEMYNAVTAFNHLLWHFATTVTLSVATFSRYQSQWSQKKTKVVLSLYPTLHRYNNNCIYTDIHIFNLTFDFSVGVSAAANLLLATRVGFGLSTGHRRCCANTWTIKKTKLHSLRRVYWLLLLVVVMRACECTA